MPTLKPIAGARVLLVDDEIDHLQLRAYVMKHCGFAVITASDALQALSLAEEELTAVAVAVIDYHMPVMNGCVLADRLRSMCPELKIILNSGATDIPQSEMTSIDAFIWKGDGMARLVAQVEEFARAASRNSNALPV